MGAKIKKHGVTSLGALAEDVAVAYLLKRRYDILERNYRTRWGEIDIIARDGATLVFIEVKARKGNVCGLPQEAVGRQKQFKIIRMAQQYMHQYDTHSLPQKKQSSQPIRFDVIAIVFNGDVPTVEHIPHAFDATDLLL